MRLLHDAALVLWIGLLLSSQVALVRARRGGGIGPELDVRRRWRPALVLEHAALVVALLAGLMLMQSRGWSTTHPRWLGLKLGLVVFVVVPLEAMHAWVGHVWIPRGLRGLPPRSAPMAEAPLPRPLERALGMDDMVRTLAAVLLAAALPLIVWLSLRQPF